MSYHHFTTFERGRIEALHTIGLNTRKIAQELGRHHSAIARELRRNQQDSRYTGVTAQCAYEHRRKASKPKGKYTKELQSIIEEHLQATWSPEQIVHSVAQGKVSFKTIYRWLYQGKLMNGKLNLLRQKGKRRKLASKRGIFVHGTSISNRPAEVKSRETFGHWELDTVVSSRGESKGCFATFLERKTRLFTAIAMQDRTASSMEEAIKRLHANLPKGAFKSATTDRGKEFACYRSVEQNLNIQVFFADPYSSWQRGSNENSNGLLREFYPKKTNLEFVNQKQLAASLRLINSRPRKCLNWKTPIQLFLHEVSHLT